MFKWIANRCYCIVNHWTLVGFIFHWKDIGYMAFTYTEKLGVYATQEAAQIAVEAAVTPPSPQLSLLKAA